MSRLALHTSNKTACVVGATGLVGTQLLQALSKHQAYQRIVAVCRSEPWGATAGKVQWIQLPSPSGGADTEIASRAAICEVLPKGDDFYSCLGTTRAKAGGAEKFEHIDYDLNLAFAEAAIERGYKQYLLVSSVGADARSSFLYTRVKGKLELAAKTLPFWSVHIFQPGLLLGERNDNRFGENLAKPLFKGLNWLSSGMLGKYRPVEAEALAESMVAAAQHTSGGNFTYQGEELHRLAEAYYLNQA